MSHTDSPSPGGVRLLVTMLTAYLREAWRLQRQHQAQNKGERSVLPENMLATPATVRRDLARLADLERESGGIKAALASCHEWLQWEAGAVGEWIEPKDGRHAWRDLFQPLKEAVAAALILHRQAEDLDDESFRARVIEAHDWSSPGRAGVELDFAVRAFELLLPARREGALPLNARATKLAEAPLHSRALLVAVLDFEGRILGQADHLEAAIKQAKQAHLAGRPIHELSFDQFQAITTVVGVTAGRGKTGEAKTGSERLLTADLEDLTALRSFLSSAFEHATRRGDLETAPDAQEAAEQKKAWVENSVGKLLGQSFEGAVKSMILPGAGHLLFAKGGSDAARPALMRAIHRNHVISAAQQGEEIPKRVLDELGFSMDEAGLAEPAAERERARAS